MQWSIDPKTPENRFTAPIQPMPDEGNASDVVYEFIKDAVAAEDDRKSSIEQRGAAVVTTIGALVTLLFGLVAVITNVASFTLPTSAHGPLFGALIAFVIAAGLGIVSTVPFRYKHANPQELEQTVMGWDGATSSQGQRKMALTYLDLYRRQLSRNARKAFFLVAATIGEVAGLALLSWAVACILMSTAPAMAKTTKPTCHASLSSQLDNRTFTPRLPFRGVNPSPRACEPLGCPVWHSTHGCPHHGGFYNHPPLNGGTQCSIPGKG